MKNVSYFLGCPVWACPHWQGSLFTRHARREQYLAQYSRVFTSVEGNSTFYGLPALDTVRRWAESVEEPFHFVLKFPQAISHDRRLLNAGEETEAFLAVLHVLQRRDALGPSFLQLPSGFSPHHLGDLENYLRQLPREFPYAVEVRHHDFFDNGHHEKALNQLLSELRIDRVIFDSRPLYSAEPEDDFERQSQSRKPQLPVHTGVTGRRPLIRLIGRNDIGRVLPWIRQWAPVVARWIIDGLSPYVFTHTPNDLYAPALARLFHRELMRHTHRLEELPPWPGEAEPQPSKQLALF